LTLFEEVYDEALVIWVAQRYFRSHWQKIQIDVIQLLI